MGPPTDFLGIEESENKLAWANGNPADSTTIYINHKDNNVLAGGTLAIKAISECALGTRRARAQLC